MSEFKYCQGPICHEHKTKDRIRGPKGDKHYETRKRSRFYYGKNFCSLGCQDEWFAKFGEMAVDHFGRTREPKRTDASSAWYKDYSTIITMAMALLILITSSMIYLANADQSRNNSMMTRT